MNQELKEACDLLVDNRGRIYDRYGITVDLVRIAGALMGTFSGAPIDPEAITEGLTLYAEDRNRVIRLDHNNRLPILIHMANSGYPTEYFHKYIGIYNTIADTHLTATDEKPNLALLLCDHNLEDRAKELNDKEFTIHRAIHKKYPMQGSMAIYHLACVQAFGNRSAEAILGETDELYERLKRPAPCSKTLTLSVSQALSTLEGSATHKAEAFLQIYKQLKPLKYDKHEEILPLCALVNLSLPPEQIRQAMAEANDYLSQYTGFDFWGIGTKSRLAYCALLVASVFDEGRKISDGNLDSADLYSLLAKIYYEYKLLKDPDVRF